MKRNIIIVLLALTYVGAWAVPAKRDGRLMTAADGTTKMVFMHGNEYAHYLTDAEGTVLDEETFLPKASSPAAEEDRVLRRAGQLVERERVLAPRGPIILVSFSDEAYQHDQALMADWAMGEHFDYNGATGSIRQYFHDVSFGQFEMELDVYGPVTVSKNAAYYGSNIGDYDAHPDEMVVEACQLAAEEGADFSQYDSDGDGYVDWVVILYAGKGEADSYIANRIWPHQAELHDTGKAFQLNGKTVDHYCCLNEISAGSGQLCGIGTFCHEFGHIMGLPDFYATIQNAYHKTSGKWDIMDYGCYNNDDNTPCGYTAYERWFMGWMQPALMNEAVSVTMPDLYTHNDAAYITQSGDSITDITHPYPNVFYLFENRQPVGWDTYIPGHGLLITRVNYRSTWWNSNTVNNTASNMGMDILEADGLKPSRSVINPNNGYFGKQGDAYPTDSVNTFTDVTGFPVTNIVETDGVITFDVLGGGEPMILEVEENQDQKEECRKMLINGRVVIRRGGKIYDLLGRMITAL